MLPRLLPILLLTLTAAAAPSTHPAPTSAPSTRPALLHVYAPARPTGRVLYLSGVSDFRPLDHGLVDGLAAAKPATAVDTYTWAAYNPGAGALLAYNRNRVEALAVGDLIARARRERPAEPFTVVAHSGGCGIAAWALESLPQGVSVDRVLFLAPALSPGYDLSPALRHVEHSLYVFSSPDDPALGVLTQTFGTIDRVPTEAAGLHGFTRPDAPAHPAEYAKLTPVPYRPEWIHYDHPGDHIGYLEPAFAKAVLAPLLP